MARKPATAAAPSPTDQGTAGDEQAKQLAAEQEAKAKEEAQAKAKAEADAKTEAEDKAKAEADAKAEAQAKARDEAAAKAADADKPAAKDGAWALPEVTEFPVTLSLNNASPSPRSLAGIGLFLEPNEQRDFEFTDVTFEKFSRYITQIALLNGWKAGEGLLIEQEASDGED